MGRVRLLIIAMCLATPLLAQRAPAQLSPLWGPDNRPSPAAQARIKTALAGKAAPAGIVHRWNEVALDANALDHTPVEAGESRVFGEEIGPGRTARALAIVHIAIFEATNAIDPRYESYTGLAPEREKNGASRDAAVAVAAHDALVAMFPSQRTTFDKALVHDLSLMPDSTPKRRGIALGVRAAASILTMRKDDHSSIAELSVGMGFTPSQLPGFWRPDPVSMNMVALGVHWGEVKPFVLSSTEPFPMTPPPAIGSAEYAAAFNDVKRLGGDGITTPTARTPDQTMAGIFWGYDGTPGLGTPPRFYNQIVVHIADQLGTDEVDLARLLALVNTALADTGMGCWHEKYAFQYWRPVTAIREADAGTGPSGLGDGNPDTTGDPTFTPLGAPASNLLGSNFTPPFPAYASGHAAFAGTLFQMLRDVYRTDAVPFTIVSDEFNGITTDHDGHVRPYAPRTFPTFSAAEEENGQSRIYLGIHWGFDKTTGIADGRKIADYVFAHAFRPIGK